MSAENNEMDLLDGYVNGTLSAEERQRLDARLATDEAFRERVEEHARLTSALKFYHDRTTLKNLLNQFHEEIDREDKPVVVLNQPARVAGSVWKRYLIPMSVAASIALFSVLGTLLITRNLEAEQTTAYKELRRTVDQIKKSQTLIMKGIQESKGKSNTLTIYAGTGFLISANGFIATSYHVVRDADSVYIENPKFGQLKAAVYYSDPDNDVAILKIVTPGFAPGRLPFVIQSVESDLGEYACTLGYPREDVVFGEGSVSASTGYRQNMNSYQVSVPVNPGNSGGPLLNANGDLIGMISGIQTETSGATFAIKSTVLLDVLKAAPADSLSEPVVLPKQNTIRRASRVDQIKKWKELVFMIRVYNN